MTESCKNCRNARAGDAATREVDEGFVECHGGTPQPQPEPSIVFWPSVHEDDWCPSWAAIRIPEWAHIPPEAHEACIQWNGTTQPGQMVRWGNWIGELTCYAYLDVTGTPVTHLLRIGHAIPIEQLTPIKD